MTFPNSAAVVGLGLMGGSLVRDLVAEGVRVLAYDSRPQVVETAIAEGVAVQPMGPSLAAVAEVELIILATPVDHTIELIDRVAPFLSPGAVVTDLGSTKAAVVAHAELRGIGPRFIGSHPIAGDHRSGWEATRRSLYRGATVYLCPTESTEDSTANRVHGLWTALGSSCTTLPADEHDALMAWVSHLPQIASSAVAATLASAEHSPGDLGPGGRDLTRLAASSPEMWAPICLENRDPIRKALRVLQAELATFDDALERGDSAALHAFFRRGREWLVKQPPTRP